MHSRGLTLTESLVATVLLGTFMALVAWAIQIRRASLPQVASIQLKLYDDVGTPISELETGQPFHGHVGYRLRENSAPIERVKVGLGMYVNDQFLTADSRLMAPQRHSMGPWLVRAPLHAAPHAGTFHIRCEMYTENKEWHLVHEREIRIDKPVD